MSIQKPINIPGRRKVITKNMILRAQGETSSNMAAARWMGVSYTHTENGLNTMVYLNNILIKKVLVLKKVGRHTKFQSMT